MLSRDCFDNQFKIRLMVQYTNKKCRFLLYKNHIIVFLKIKFLREIAFCISNSKDKKRENKSSLFLLKLISSLFFFLPLIP
jgi:hypothetical protein